MLLLAVALTGVVSSFFMALGAIRTTREMSFAVQIAQQEIELMRDAGFQAVPTGSGSFDVVPLNGQGTVNVTAVNTSLKKIEVTVTWTSGAGRSMRKELVTYMSNV
jgi:type II secretory pathway pseudopilin PulG